VFGRSFRALLGATAVSDAANGVFGIAAALTVARLTRSPWGVAAVGVAATAPWLLLGVPMGMVVDSISRRRAIAGANLGRGTLMLACAAWSYGGAMPVLVLLVAVFLVGVLQVLVDTAAEALVPEVVDRNHLTRANGALAVATRVSSQFVGPAAAGTLFAVATGLPSLVSGVSCLLAAAVLILLAPGQPRPAPTLPPARLALWTGVRQLCADPVLRTLVLVSGGTTLVNAAYMTALVLYAVAPGPLGLSPRDYGMAVAVIGVGAALGSLATASFEARVGSANVLWLSRVGWALVFVSPLLAVGRTFVVAAGLGSVFGGMWAVMAMSIRQRTVPSGLRGQVGGAFRMLTYGCLPVGSLVGGAVISLWGPTTVFVAAATSTLAMIFPLRRWLSDGRLSDAECRLETR
jgi:MFS family permease